MKKIPRLALVSAFLALSAVLPALDFGFGLYGGPATSLYSGSLAESVSAAYAPVGGGVALSAPGLAYSAGAFGELWILPWLGAGLELGAASRSGGFYGPEGASWTLTGSGIDLGFLARGRIPLRPVAFLLGLGAVGTYLPSDPVERQSLGGVSTTTRFALPLDWLFASAIAELGAEFPLPVALGPSLALSLRGALRCELGLMSMTDRARFGGEILPLSFRLIFSAKAGPKPRAAGDAERRPD